MKSQIGSHRLIRRTLLVSIAVGAALSSAADDPPTAADTTAAADSPGVSMIESTGEAARWWPRWRGPSGQGRVVGEGFVDSWSAESNIRWRVPVPGSGNSSPIVWGDRLFLTTSHDGGLRRSVLCFRRSDGTLLWEVSAPEARPEAFHPKNGPASSTPATDGERVYAWFGNHGLLAVDFKGRTVWHRALGKFDAYHGTASSPLLYKDSVIVAQDQRGRSFIAAFDRKTGEEKWSTKRSESVGWSTPIAVRVGDHDEIVLSGQQAVRAYDPDTGRELWHARGNTYEAIPTPVVEHGLLYCSSGRAGPTLAIRPGGQGDVTGSHVAWRAAKGSPFVPSTVLDDGILYMVNDMSSVATAYDARIGEPLWQGRLGKAAREGFSASPVVTSGKIFFTNDEGDTFVLAGGREFKLLHVNSLGEPVLASPALVNGTWYMRGTRHLYAIGK
jgi:outer membrane protein assembly factor BamB